jgi:hypothetical protein
MNMRRGIFSLLAMAIALSTVDFVEGKRPKFGRKNLVKWHDLLIWDRCLVSVDGKKGFLLCRRAFLTSNFIVFASKIFSLQDQG